MEVIVNSYYADNALKLHKVVDSILRKFGEIPDKSEFYSLANEVFVDVIRRYDGVQNFDGFLYSCLSNKVKTEFTKRNRKKRKIAGVADISLDTPIGDDGSGTLGDVIAANFDLEKEVLNQSNIPKGDKMEKYLKRLSNHQQRIVELLLDGFTPFEIREKLHITEKEYSDHMRLIKAYDNISILF